MLKKSVEIKLKEIVWMYKVDYFLKLFFFLPISSQELIECITVKRLFIINYMKRLSAGNYLKNAANN